MRCVCRNCGSRYVSTKSRAGVKGYCSKPCVLEKARKNGFVKPKKAWETPKKSMVQVLSEHNLVGDVPEDLD